MQFTHGYEAGRVHTQTNVRTAASHTSHSLCNVPPDGVWQRAGFLFVVLSLLLMLLLVS